MTITTVQNQTWALYTGGKNVSVDTLQYLYDDVQIIGSYILATSPVNQKPHGAKVIQGYHKVVAGLLPTVGESALLKVWDKRTGRKYISTSPVVRLEADILETENSIYLLVQSYR